MEEGWTLVYSSSQLFEIEILKSMLLEHDIQSVIINKKDSFYLFGDVELYVKVEDAFEATQLIKNN